MDRFKSYINGRSVGILGLGVSNLPIAELLCDMGEKLVIRDKKTPEELGERAVALADKGVRFISGSGCFDDITEDILFRSPGLRPDTKGLADAVSRGATITSDIELLLEFSSSESFAITGSDGKTTSTTLTGLFLKEEAKRREMQVFVGGNIGVPLFTKYAEMTEDNRLVLELSSFQLMTVTKAPENIAITNVTPNHLDWHGEMSEYIEAKKRIIGKETRRVVVNFENEITKGIGIDAARDGKQAIFFSSKRGADEILSSVPEGSVAVFERDGSIAISDGESETSLLSVASIKVPGRHNVENFMTAIALTYGSVDNRVYEAVAADFGGVEHRLEWVRRLDGVDYYNSSIDSSPTRTAAALSALEGRDMVVICGGYDKKIPYEPLAEALMKYARGVVLTGATRDKISDAIESVKATSDGELEVSVEPDFKNAVLKARSMANEGGCVLLSPASASFDAFKNFAERGNTFKRIVLEL